ncbi:3-oxoacyl-ACP reductase FabG [Aestuariibacter sp. AA17]|uniref:3-oxoacyl-ACP reductase FabG n=2 Tax=Fluctibacter corallii TaxID=2984329 RepID=A0ABT3A9V3_9ALTE|nr:3-oxoacyl-ACP reductase FabG [Aestuariibacter sp. AA17]
MLNEQYFLVTGASGGIGQAVCRALVATGATVFMGGRNEQILELLATELGDNAIPFCYDVTNQEEVKAAFQHIQQHVGQLSGLVNCAGIMVDAGLAMTRMTDVDALLDVNVKSTFLHCQLASRLMARQKRGNIINLCSVVGEKGSVGQSAYAMSKAAITGLTRALSKELGPVGIRVNGVAPGFIDTQMTAHYDDSKKAALMDTISLGRLGQPDDVADAIVALLSDQLRYVTGQILHVDGGMQV